MLEFQHFEAMTDFRTEGDFFQNDKVEGKSRDVTEWEYVPQSSLLATGRNAATAMRVTQYGSARNGIKLRPVFRVNALRSHPKLPLLNAIRVSTQCWSGDNL